jgi:hypothetical protein
MTGGSESKYPRGHAKIKRIIGCKKLQPENFKKNRGY